MCGADETCPGGVPCRDGACCDHNAEEEHGKNETSGELDYSRRRYQFSFSMRTFFVVFVFLWCCGEPGVRGTRVWDVMQGRCVLRPQRRGRTKELDYSRRRYQFSFSMREERFHFLGGTPLISVVFSVFLPYFSVFHVQSVNNQRYFFTEIF